MRRKDPSWPCKDFRDNSVRKPPRIAAVMVGLSWVNQGAQTRSEKRRIKCSAELYSLLALRWRCLLRHRSPRAPPQTPKTLNSPSRSMGGPAPDGARTGAEVLPG